MSAKPKTTSKKKQPSKLVAEPTPTNRFNLTLLWQKSSQILAGLAIGLFILLAGYNAVYANKIYPGIKINGFYVGGLTKDKAYDLVKAHTDNFKQGSLIINYNQTSWKISLTDLKLDYDVNHAVAEGFDYGRKGNIVIRLWSQLRTLLGKPTNVAVYTYNIDKLIPYVNSITDDIDQKVINATLNFNNGQTMITPAQIGHRLDIGHLVLLLQQNFTQANAQTIEAPIYQVLPIINAADLTPLKSQVAKFISAPIIVKINGYSETIDQNQILSWLTVSKSPINDLTITGLLDNYYRLPNHASLTLNDEQVKAFVAGLANRTDSTAQDAVLTISNGVATVFQPSHNGYRLDQDKAFNAIKNAASASANSRIVTLTGQVLEPLVREGNLNNLGIKELISEGVTYFPGSPWYRITNVRIGASKFNGVLIKPGATFSFGEILGDVGPAQGYQPGLIILNDHEEKQYGGGLCQVSSTAYRAALLAGLPIVQRTNHSFAVSYYTAPFGVPGVDATIYYPQVDLKFTNDTGAYILIQTILEGTTLKFDFYGTKTKHGVIRGPYFVFGSNDATKPSKTVFYRDVVQNGQVIKTDTIYTYYKSSLDFPITPETN